MSLYRFSWLLFLSSGALIEKRKTAGNIVVLKNGKIERLKNFSIKIFQSFNFSIFQF